MSGWGLDWLFDGPEKKVRREGPIVKIIVNDDKEHPFRLHNDPQRAIQYARGMFTISGRDKISVVSKGRVIWERDRNEERKQNGISG